MKIAFILGSMSQHSMTQHIAKFVTQILTDVEIEKVNINDLPLYTQDLDQQEIPEYTRVRQQLKQADLVLIITPEHNRSIPAALKNILDIGSRPAGQNIWGGKKVAVLTASPGAYGGINAGLHLRQILQAVGSRVLTSEVYLSQAHTALNENGEINNDRTATFLTKFAHNVIDFMKS